MPLTFGRTGFATSRRELDRLRRPNPRLDPTGLRPAAQRRTLFAAVLLVIIPSFVAILVAPAVTEELRKALYAGAVTLIFAGLLGGLLKILLDDVAAVKRKREDAATFVINVVADLKSVYDRVARARVLIPAHIERLSDFIGEAKQYCLHFETPLDDASEWLRGELARILSNKPLTRAHAGTRRSNPALNADVRQAGSARSPNAG